MRKAKVGVYICHCGTNIAGTVAVTDAAQFAARLDNVVVARDYRYMCSSTGQEIIKQDIKDLGLERVVVAACSPLMHEFTFRAVIAEAGLNPYFLGIANIREQCSWITHDVGMATQKAKQLIRAAVARVVWQEPLEEREVEVEPAALVVGGGIAGIQAALSIATPGYKVYLVEQESSIGGRMAQLDKTFPTLDCSACILTPKMVNLAREKNIELLTCSEVVAVTGYVGNFEVKVKKNPRYVDLEKCTGCGECVSPCPVEVPHHFDHGLGQRKAIYRLFPQAVPGAYIIQKEGIPPCRAACPAEVNAQGYVALIGQGKIKEALDLIRRDNPFPAVCGRVCHHPCEDKCTRREADEPIAICALKRFVTDHTDGRSVPLERTKAERVAVIGAGPAGLSAAYHLLQKGYGVTVFEALPLAGGMLATSIPPYRLPKEILAKEIAYIEGLGAEIRTNSPIGREVKLSSLFEQGYSAIFIAVGAQRSQRLAIAGENLNGVFDGLTFLREVNLGKQIDLTGQRVGVIGGGNTAIDAARSALRLGAKEVAIIYRRTQEEMPALREEVVEAVKEGVQFHILAAPTKVLGQNGKVVGIECLRMALGEIDESGRRRPIPIPGSEFTLGMDTLIIAIGQSPDLSFLDMDLATTPQGTITVDPQTLATNVPGIFAGGDVVSGPATVIEAIAAGKRAAESIDRYLSLEDLIEGRVFEIPAEKIVKKKVTEEIECKPRAQIAELSLKERVHNFQETTLGLSQEVALKEAGRCLNCAVCAECLQCEAVCGPKAIAHDMKEEYVDLKVGTIILATGHDFFDPRVLPQYNYGRFPNIIDSMAFERMCSASGPTGGNIVLSNGEVPKSVAFIHCVGCRDSHALPYCSRLCCMHAMKQAHLVKEKTGADVYELYIDIRAGGKGYEEFYERVQREGVIFIRGRGAEVVQQDGHLVVKAEDTGLGRPLILRVDLVVLVVGLIHRADTAQVARIFRVSRDKDGFFMEAHPKLRPFHTNTDGIFLAGTCQSPKDIPDTVAHANAAAAEALSLLGRGRVLIEPLVAEINAEICSGCKTCLELCAYSAITFDEEKRISQVNTALCRGCGTCAAACPSGAITASHFTDQQILAEIEALLMESEPVSIAT
ncbi:MAG: NAD(P)-binding protein [Chloroflexi bacterium]|nr:NAD(P)-binding protein [Chloroflexota bacterium]MCL5075189.1 NAD(P)-binding protein [Chloroflexota bacterium]